MEIDRELLLQVLGAITDQLYAVHDELREEHVEQWEKMNLLEILLIDDKREDPLERRIKKYWDELTHAAREKRRAASQRFRDGIRRIEQMKMMVEGKSLNEIDHCFSESDKRMEERRREWQRSFDNIIGRR